VLPLSAPTGESTPLVRRVLARLGWAFVFTNTHRCRIWQVSRRRWHFAVSFWRDAS